MKGEKFLKGSLRNTAARNGRCFYRMNMLIMFGTSIRIFLRVLRRGSFFRGAGSAAAAPNGHKSNFPYDQTGLTPGPTSMAGLAPFLGTNFWARPLSTSAT